MSFETAIDILDIWTKDGLKNVRFSGGEPTLYEKLPELVEFCRTKGVKRIAVSTNGSANIEDYVTLVKAGVNDMSISLDACCASFAETMSGGKADFQKITDNIKLLSGVIYTTAGIVVTNENLSEIRKTVEFASGLGVDDIRIISSTQFNKTLATALSIPYYLRIRHPILKYRLDNIIIGRNVRGLQDGDAEHCYLAADDMAVAGTWHFPCIIYLREGGKPIGEIGPNMRTERLEWLKKHNPHNDPICKTNCLDVCVDYNNKARELSGWKFK